MLRNRSEHGGINHSTICDNRDVAKPLYGITRTIKFPHWFYWMPSIVYERNVGRLVLGTVFGIWETEDFAFDNAHDESVAKIMFVDDSKIKLMSKPTIALQ